MPLAEAQTGMGIGKLYIRVEKSGRSQVCSDWGLLAWAIWMGYWKRGILCHCFGESIWLSLMVLSWSRGKNREVGSLDQSCLFWSSCCRGCDLACWTAYVIQSLLSHTTWPLSICIVCLSGHRERHWVSPVPFIQVSFLP